MSRMDLAVVGNCSIASMIDKSARHVWFCFPRLDGDPAFNALVNDPDPEAGFMDIVLDRFVSSEQRYLRNTAVVETILTAADGASMRVIDFAPRFKRFGRQFRPPMIVRRIEPLSGSCRITVRIRPSFGYGTVQPTKTFGSNHMRFVSGADVLRLTTDMPVSYVAQEAPFVLHRPVNLFLGSDESVPERPDMLAREFLEETVAYWQDWVRDLAVPFEWQDAVIRAAITLKLCSYEDTGAIVAALTTSLPEHANSGRNWDYRYCWMRDAFFTVHSLNRLGATLTMENYLTYVLDSVLSADLGKLAPLYPIVPGSSTEEIISTGLRGFMGMGPVRIGNAAASQRQNDIYGSVILAAAQMFWDDRLPRPGDLSLYQQLRPIGLVAEAVALEPDAGIWEYRGRSRPHTFSAIMCWAAVHRLGLIAGKLGETDDARQWMKSAIALRERIIAEAWNEEGGYFAGSLGGSEVDAALLLMPEIGMISHNDPRFLSTLKVMEERLLRGGLMMRYTDADDFGTPETAFLVCSFWYVDILVTCGRRQEARDLFQRILDMRNHVGLLSEDVAFDSGQLWGNFPQSYSMVGLIHSALRLSRSWEEGVWRVS